MLNYPAGRAADRRPRRALEPVLPAGAAMALYPLVALATADRGRPQATISGTMR
jgi:hypothetical protein